MALGVWTRPRFINPASIKIYDRNQILLYETSAQKGRHQDIKIDSLPKYLINAVVASEDSSFWTNPGFDLLAMLRAFRQNLTAGRVVSGASTISQQLVRQAFANSRFVVLRKIREVLAATQLTLFYPKKTILEMYLNQVYFGAQSYGIEAASESYFGKQSTNLSLAESSLLVGLISSPEFRNPITNLPEAIKYQHLVLERMVAQHYLSEDEANNAKAEKLTFISPDVAIKAPHFVHMVLNQLPTLKIDTEQNLKIYTSLDYPVYELSREIASFWVEQLKEKHDLTNAAVVLLDNQSGEILSLLGGINYFDASNSGEVNMATAQRQPGSALKPITYATGFMQNLTPATVIYDIPKVFRTQKNEGFKPQNYDGRYHGMVLARTALASSLNLPAVEVLSQVGLPAFFQTSQALGITSFTDTKNLDLAVTLGGGAISLLELSNAYAAIARGGNFLPTHSINRITTDFGFELYKHTKPKTKLVFGQNSAQISYLISDILADPKARMLTFGEKNPLVMDHTAAVKTGTTSDWHDNWTVGYTPDFTVGVWVGNPDNHPMRQITGVVGAAPIWNQFFSEFLKTKPKQNFARPEGLVDVEICTFDGKLPNNSCPNRTVEKFIIGTEPKEITAYPNYPPEVYSWAMTEGLIDPKQKTAISSAPVAITFPVYGAVFQTAPQIVNRESVVFQINVIPGTQIVSWYVDDKLAGEATKFPFSWNWKPVAGKHTVNAIVHTSAEQNSVSGEVPFSVINVK